MIVFRWCCRLLQLILPYREAGSRLSSQEISRSVIERGCCDRLQAVTTSSEPLAVYLKFDLILPCLLLLGLPRGVLRLGFAVKVLYRSVFRPWFVFVSVFSDSKLFQGCGWVTRVGHVDCKVP